MKHGFVKVAACSPNIRVADLEHNSTVILEQMKEASQKGARIIVFPELCLTGYTCGDLFLQELLLRKAKEKLLMLAKETEQISSIVLVGLPLEYMGNLYNVAAVLYKGSVLGLIPKTYLPNYAEFYELRHFTRGMKKAVSYRLTDQVTVPLGTEQIFVCSNLPELRFAVELCEDLWAPIPPSMEHALAGANVLINLSASNEVVGKAEYRKNLVSGQSARLVCGYIYASASDGESTQDVVYSGHNLIAENGTVLAESERFENGILFSEIDVFKLEAERQKMTTFSPQCSDEYTYTEFTMELSETDLSRQIAPFPFVPADSKDRQERCEEIFLIQAMGLKKRLEHTGCQCAVVGISGGLDSTLALLVTVKAYDLLGISHDKITAITMPGFGTTGRTYDNAVSLIRSLGAELLEIPIADAVMGHFKDIGQDPQCHDITYENAQARERTQILMDVANKKGGMVIGTGDMSELALGWATYNGDHMSMYGVNASVPKTLVRHLVRYYADTCGKKQLADVLYDVLDTPVSPELLPPKDGKIAQKTEDLVGPYELHDFYMYYVLRFGYAPEKIFRLAKKAFEGRYEKETILKWLKTFYRRFFSQQFKRSCLPDGPKVGTVAVSPRGDLRMPSDASGKLWLEEIEFLDV